MLNYPPNLADDTRNHVIVHCDQEFPIPWRISLRVAEIMQQVCRNIEEAPILACFGIRLEDCHLHRVFRSTSQCPYQMIIFSAIPSKRFIVVKSIETG